jgi:phthalate 4,5-cis-dihydrodiol dehydrogenase
VSEPILRLGIAGLGQAGAMLLPALQRSAAFRLTAIADPDEELRAAWAKACEAGPCADLAALAARADVDVVYIATPTELHAVHAIEAVRAGKHVIVEKPMALGLDDADEMIEAAAAAGVQLISGHSRSFEPPIREMRRLVASGELGTLGMLHTWYYTDWLYRPRRPAELDTLKGGGVVFRQASHQVDLLRWIGGGRVASVRAATGRWDPGRPTEGAYTLFLQFDEGHFATAVFSGYDHFQTPELAGVDERGRPASETSHAAARRRLTTADEAALKRVVGAEVLRPEAPAYASMPGLTVVSCARGDIRQAPGGLRVYGDHDCYDVPIPPLPDGRDLLLEEAYQAIVEGRPAAHDGCWGKANLEVCLAALESARTRREIALLHQVPTPD